MFRRLVRLLRYALPYRGHWALIFLTTLAGTFMTLLHPWPIKILIDNVLQQQDAPAALRPIVAPFVDPRMALLGCVVLFGLLIFAINNLSDVLLTRAWVRIGQGMVWSLARDLYARLQRRSVLFHSRNHVGDSMSRITGDSWAVYTLVDTLIFAPVTALVMLIMMLIVMVRMDLTMTLLALAVAPLMAGGAWLLAGPVGALAKARRELDSRMHSHLQQTLAGIPVVQAFAQEQREHDRFKSIAESALHMHRRAALLSGANELTNGMIATIGTGAILLVGGYRVLGGDLTAGGLLVFLAYLRTLQTQLRILTGMQTALRTLRANVDRVMEVMEIEPEIRDQPNTVAMPHIEGHVRLNDITFGYEPGRAVLQDVSLEASPGETIAVVGPTGAGKSTLVSLISRLMDPWQGQVTIDGVDVRDIRLADLRRQVAVVPQETVLFPISIAQNIAYGRPDATRDEIVAAARAANLHAFIETLENGYDTVVGERGATLSGGERQRVSIARALLVDAPILILDEPTSSLDVATERLVLEDLDRLMAGRTTFIIAHRLSTIRDADRIVVIDQGTIVESGTHESLLAEQGLYARLHQIQTHGAAMPLVGATEVTQ